jgi:TetR/AcrR family transcriptional regulator, tetracycline repressor protein
LALQFKNNQELLDEIATSVLSEAIEEMLPDQQGEWPGLGHALGHGFRQMRLRHRDGAKMFSGTYMTNSSLYLPIEAALRRWRKRDSRHTTRSASIGPSTVSR